MSQDIALKTYLNVEILMAKSTVLQRTVAYIIDWILKLVYIFFIVRYLNVNWEFTDNTQWFQYLYSILITLPIYAYTPLMEYFTKGRTLGKIALGIKVVGANGLPPSAAQCVIRWLFIFADFYAGVFFMLIQPNLGFIVFISPVIAFLMVVFTENSQRLGDIAAGTFTIKERQKEYTLEDTIYAFAREESAEYKAVFPQIIKLSDKDMTLVKDLLERSDSNYELCEKLSLHLQKILNVDTNMEHMAFLKQLLRDYNFLSQKK